MREVTARSGLPHPSGEAPDLGPRAAASAAANWSFGSLADGTRRASDILRAAFACAAATMLLVSPAAAGPGKTADRGEPQAATCANGAGGCGQASLAEAATSPVPGQVNEDHCASFRPPSALEAPAGGGTDEFVGPFPSWSDLKRDYGAKGDGISDDTDALQRALNDLRTSARKSPILFVPAGVYLVKRTVTLAAAKNISLIGEDPRTTVLKWAGASFTYPATSAMLHVDGVSYSRLDRLTFDGNGAGVVLVDQSVRNYTEGRQFDTGNEYADDIFQNGLIGIQGGQYDLGAAETTILRSKFLHNGWGVLLKNFNTLDWWVWYSYFEDNGSSISNIPGAGNFHAFNNIFKRSKFADLALLNTGTFNFRDNFSIGSKKFLYEQFYYTNAAVTRLQHNTVITPKGNDCNGCAVDKGNMGPIVLTDNVFVSPPDTPAAVLVRSLNPPDCLSVGNVFTSAEAVQCGLANSGRMISVDDTKVESSTVNPSPPPFPDPPQNRGRKVFEVPARATASIIQQEVDQAAALCGSRPIVHLPYGTYNVNRTIVLPPKCDVQLVGDGGQTRLTWAGADGGILLLLAGPSRAILRDFHISAGRGVGIDINNADQPGSRVYMQQTSALRALDAAIFVDGLDYTNVELHDFQIAYTAVAPASTGIGLKVVGGPLAREGRPQSGRTSLLAGSGATNHLSYSVSGGGNLIVRDSWYESNSSSNFAQVSDNSSVTIEGTRISNSGGTGGLAAPTVSDAVELDKHSCNATLLASAPDSAFRINSGSTDNAWAVGNNFGTASAYFSNAASNTHSAFSLNRRYSRAEGSLPLPDEAGTPETAFVRRMLSQSRSTHPSEINDLPAGVTDVRLFRIWVELGRVGIHIHG